MPQHYPFSAVVGCEVDALDDMGLALVLTAIAPAIGGVLVRGEKGTAKSTAVRALAGVLPAIPVRAADRFSTDPDDPGETSPDGPFADDAETLVRPVRLVELPVGATEDRVLGSVHLERALSAGEIEFEPGLLARAHRGVLYVDEVNLLHDHLVDLLLDAAATGHVTVERDGVSVEHAARFVLIGTMNPEEGELRPQLLDRFGLTVEVAAPREASSRMEVVRRRMAFDDDPAAFVDRYRSHDRVLTERIESARARLPSVRLTDAALLKVAEVCAAFEVDGLRADIVTARAAVAHAAWEGRDQVTRSDIRRAALLALPHRRRRNPFDAPGLDVDLLDRVLGDDELPPEPPDGPAGGPPEDQPTDGPGDGPGDGAEHREPGAGDPAERDDAPGGAGTHAAATPDQPGGRSEAAPDQPGGRSDGSVPAAPAGEDTDGTSRPAGSSGGPGTVVAAAATYRPRLLEVPGQGQGSAGRRSRSVGRSGRRTGAARGGTGPLHLVETLRAAAAAQPGRGHRGGRPQIRSEDLRVAVREGREANLVLFCVDASGSMAARRRMSEVKSAVLSLLLDAYRRRDKVGLITFRGSGAALVLPPTHSVEVAAARLEEMAAGGRTPLAAGLVEAAQVLQRERLRDPRLRPLLVLVTDGRATDGADAVARSVRAAEHVAALHVTTVVIDGEGGPLRLGLAVRLARVLGAEHLPVAQVSAEALTGTVRRVAVVPGQREGAA